jgi:hypothetical protein
MKSFIALAALATMLLTMTSCRDQEQTANGAAAQAPQPPPTNRVDIPPAVRQNLGITFAKVEKRRVAQTLRAPGRFELTPQARHEYRATLPGRVEFLVTQYQGVDAGTPLYRMQSPEWFEIQRETSEALFAIRTTENELRAAEAAIDEHEARIKLTRDRIAALAEAEVRRVELEQQAAELDIALPRLRTDLEIRQSAIAAAKQRFEQVVRRAGALLGLSESSLLETLDYQGERLAHWQTITQIEIRAAEPGVVQSMEVTPGGWVETSGVVLTTINPQSVRFRATGLQADLTLLRSGLPATIVAPRNDGGTPSESISAELIVGLEADPNQRTIELLATPQTLAEWMRPGVSAFLEVETVGTAEPELVVPRSAVVQDGLAHILFRRDPANPDKAIRMDADLGISNDHWAVINSGLKVGDEVVLDGVYELKLATSAQVAKGGHFHADGTFHAEN